MSANGDTVRAAHDAWNRRDADFFVEHASPDIEYVNPPQAVEPGTRHGHEGIRDVLEKQWELLGDARFEVAELYERDDEVVAVAALTRRMPGSDATISA